MNAEVVQKSGWSQDDWRCVRTFGQRVLVVAALVWSFYETNAAPVIVGLIWWLWFGIAIGIDRLELHKLKRLYRKTFFLNQSHYWTVAGGPMCVFLASTFVFLGYPFSSYHVLDRGNGEVEYYGQWVLTPYNPFASSTYFFRENQSVNWNRKYGAEIACNGRTVDGKMVYAGVAAGLTLPFEGLPAAYKASGNQHLLTKKLQWELCQRFAQTVGTYSLAYLISLPSYLGIEHKNLEGQQSMSVLGVKYSGVVFVDTPHAYAE